VIFGGIVFAAMIDGGQRLLARVLPIGRGWRIAIVLVLTAAFLVWATWFTGSQIAQQAAQMPELVETQFNRLMSWARGHGIDVDTRSFGSIMQQLATGVGPVTRALGGIVGFFTTMFLIVVLGIYIALEPRLYERGIAWMLPVNERPYLAETLGRMAHSLRRLLAGRLLGMVIEGVATWAALELYGVPMAALLGLLTGLLAFLPNIGAPISGALMVLVGFSGGTSMALYCVAVYVVIQTVDSNIIIPMVAKKTVDLAPALVLGAQLVFGVMFGILGLALADPLVAMLKILLERRSERNTAASVEGEAGPPGEPPPTRINAAA
jgi:predicted PurR-regulated permease PerM